MAILKKVTVFILRHDPQGMAYEPQILLFRHPHAGVQFPAGTVEPGETAEHAALREGCEESGLAGLRILRRLAVETETLPPGVRATVQPVTVFARPDPGSFDWAQIPRGVQVTVGRQVREFCQVSYIEWDSLPEKNFITYQISGWAQVSGLASQRRRSFYLLCADAETPPTWEVVIDHHRLCLFWAPLKNLPTLVPPQGRWARHLAGIGR
jgi:8-oxo-dGTP pyrophosphatase MutT (NUDIX family)